MLESTDIVKGLEVKEGLSVGSNKIAQAVKTTFGPFSSNVAITKFFNVPHVTKDGVTVTNSINLEDPIENVACQIIKQAAQKTAEVAGDGTTSTTLLANSIIQIALQLNINKLLLKSSLLELYKEIEVFIKKRSKEVKKEDLYYVAKVASNGDEFISKLVSDTFNVIGKEGTITVLDSKNYETKVDITEGIKLDRGFIDSSFTLNGNKVTYEDPMILSTDLDLSTLEDAMYILNLQQESKRPLLVICNDIHKKAIEIIAYNKRMNNIAVEVIRAPNIAEARKEALKDIAIITGGFFLSKDAGFSIRDVNVKQLGSCDSFSISVTETVIIGRHGNPDSIKERISYYREKIKEDKLGVKANYEKRLAMFNSGAAIIWVGGTNETEVQEVKDRLDDTIRAVRSSLIEGVVSGGTTMYMELAKFLEDKNSIREISQYGKYVLKESFHELTFEFLKNQNELNRENIQEYVLENKILDPTIVLLKSIQNAIGAASMVFITECVIIKKPKND